MSFADVLPPWLELLLFLLLSGFVLLARWGDPRSHQLSSGMLAVAVVAMIRAASRFVLGGWADELPEFPVLALITTNACLQAVDDLGLLLVALRILYLLTGPGLLVRTWLRLLIPLGAFWMASMALRVASQFARLPTGGQLRVDQILGIVFRSFYLLVSLPLLFELFSAWRRLDISRDHRVPARTCVAALPVVLLVAFAAYAVLNCIFEFWSFFMAQYHGSAAVFSGAYVIIRATAYSLVVLACRGIGWASWEHRLPVLAVFFASPMSGLRLDHCMVCPATGLVFIYKVSVRTWTTLTGTAALKSLKIKSPSGQLLVHRLVATINGLTVHTQWLVGDQSLVDNIEAMIRKAKRKSTGRRRRDRRARIRSSSPDDQWTTSPWYQEPSPRQRPGNVARDPSFVAWQWRRSGSENRRPRSTASPQGLRRRAAWTSPAPDVEDFLLPRF